MFYGNKTNPSQLNDMNDDSEIVFFIIKILDMAEIPKKC